MSSHLIESARAAVLLAKKAGADQAAATAQRRRSVDTSWRDGKVEKVEDAISRSVAIQLYVDGRYGSMSTSDLRPEALSKFVEDAVGMVRAIAKDPHRKLPDPSLYGPRTGGPDLDIFDPKVSDISAQQRLAWVKALEEAARSAPAADHIISVTTTASDSDAETARVTTNGFEGSYRGTSVGFDASVTVKDADGRRPQDWAGVSTRHLSPPDPKKIGYEATQRATQRLGAKKIASGTRHLVVEARAARSLLRHLLQPLSGGALQQKESFFEGKLGTAVAAKGFTLTDQPLLTRGLGSRPYDNEGIAARARPLIEAGTLKQFLIDVYYASKLGVAPTTGSTSNLVVTPGENSLPELLRDVKDGILVTSFLGGNSNSTTGIFSLGIAGRRIEKGELTEPIAEMNISGKHLDFWKHLVAVGNDPYVYSSTVSPSLVFEGVSIAGK